MADEPEAARSDAPSPSNCVTFASADVDGVRGLDAREAANTSL
jgi:hypothetical protein